MATAASFRRGAQARSAFTLLELLIAMGLTLLLVYAIAEFYRYAGESVRDGRALIEMGSELRSAVKQLRDDLNSVTARLEPPGDNTNAQGMFEIIEGAANDSDVNADGTPEPTASGAAMIGTMIGDLDDILTFTIRSSGAPFVGHYQYFDFSQNANPQPRTVESNLAEVVWFTTFNDLNSDGAYQVDEPRFLVRRMFLIVPNILGWRDSNGVDHFGELVDPSTNPLPDNVFQHNDVSLAAPTFNQGLNRWLWKANSLSTLTRRENRFIHLDLDLSNGSQNGLRPADAIQPAAYMPNPLMVQLTDSQSLQSYTLQGNATGEDLVLPNILAFDVRVYDPEAVLYGDDATNPLAALQPGDPGYREVLVVNQNNPGTFAPVGFGAYVDLYYNRFLGGTTFNTPFAVIPRYNPRNLGMLDPNLLRYVSYDTWSTYYERDGDGDASTPIGNQFADNVEDWAFDGIDNDGQNGVDDPGEFETSPPYVTPLRGIQVRIRLYEVGTRQTQQATVVADFVDE